MSGWDGSSRPSWDSEGPPSPGTPPDIFLQDYGSGDLARQDQGARQDQRPRQDQEEWDSALPGYRRDEDPGPHRPARPDARRNGNGRNGNGQHGNGSPPAWPSPLGHDGPEQSARMDPALRDFFAPHQPRPRQDTGPAMGQGAGHARGPWAPEPAAYRPHPDLSAQGAGAPGDWDSPPQRPGSRVTHRQEGPTGLTAIIAVGAIVLVGIAVGAYMLLTRHSGTRTPARTAPTSHPSETAAKTPAATQAAATPAGYTLSTPATAGGYAKLATIPSDVRTSVGALSQSIENAAVQHDGGKVTGQVTGAYQLSGGQVLGFTGFVGTFSPATVIASLATLGTDSHTAAAGPHGGMLTCATAPGSVHGTMCVWATPTTLGITEYFGPTGPEVVTIQAKAASDTLGFRDSVEVATS